MTDSTRTLSGTHRSDSASAGEDGSLSHSSVAHAIAQRLDPEEGDLSNGERAELRRISPESMFTPTLWRLLLDYSVEEPPPWWRDDGDEWVKRWATLVMGMTHCAGLHDRETPFGEALYEAGWSEGRFIRLMDVPPDRLHVPIRRLAQYLSSKSQSADWRAVSRLLFDSGDYAERARLSISRHYYRAQYQDEDADE